MQNLPVLSLFSFFLVFAISAQPRCLKAETDAESLFDDCYDMDESGNEAKTIACYRSVLKLDKGHMWAHNNLGYLLFQRDQRRQALEHFTSAIALDPSEATPVVNRADLLYDQFKLDKAYIDYQRAYKLDPTLTRMIFRIAEIHQDKHEFNAAVKWYTAYLSKEVDDVDALGNRGLCKYKLSLLDDALLDFDKALKLDSSMWSALLNRSLVKKAKKDYPGAVRDLDQAIKLESSQSILYETRGNVKKLQGDTKGALADADKALELNSNDVEALALKARLIERVDPKGAQLLIDRIQQLKSSKEFQLIQRERTSG